MNETYDSSVSQISDNFIQDSERWRIKWTCLNKSIKYIISFIAVEIIALVSWDEEFSIIEDSIKTRKEEWFH